MALVDGDKGPAAHESARDDPLEDPLYHKVMAKLGVPLTSFGLLLVALSIIVGFAGHFGSTRLDDPVRMSGFVILGLGILVLVAGMLCMVVDRHVADKFGQNAAGRFTRSVRHVSAFLKPKHDATREAANSSQGDN